MSRTRKSVKRTTKKKTKPARSKARTSRTASRTPKKQESKSSGPKQLTTWLTVALVVVAAIGIYRHFLAEPSAPADSERSSRPGEAAEEDSRNESASSRRRDRTDDGEAASARDRREPSRSKRKLPPPSDVEAPPDDAATTDSGLASKVLAKGSGSDHPGPRDVVTVHYTGWTTDGEMFDSSVVRGKTTSFPLNRVIKGWTEGVQLMVKGEKRRLWIPEKLAYKGRPGAPAGMLVFDIELVDFESLPD